MATDSLGQELKVGDKVLLAGGEDVDKTYDTMNNASVLEVLKVLDDGQVLLSDYMDIYPLVTPRAYNSKQSFETLADWVECSDIETLEAPEEPRYCGIIVKLPS